MSVLVVCTCILGALVMSLPKTASCTDPRSSFALLRFDTVPFVAHAGFRGVSIQRQWSRCPTRSGHSPIARLEVGTLLNSKLLNSKWVRADVNATRSGHLLKHLRNFATSSNGHLRKCHLPTWTGHLPRRGRRPRTTTDSPPTRILESSSTPHLGQLLAFGPSSWLKPKLCLIGMSCVNPRQRGPDDNTPPSTLPEVHCRLNAK